MPRPTLPASGATPWDVQLATAINAVSDAADAAQTTATAAQGTANTALSSTASGVPGTALVDTFAGATDDAKFAAARSYAAAQTVPPALSFSARDYNLPTAFNMYDGFFMKGAPGVSNPELSNKGTNRTRILAKMPGGGIWMNNAGGGRSASQVWDTGWDSISFVGNSGTQFLGGGSNVMWSNKLRDHAYSSFKTVFGSQATKLLINLCVWDGWCELENSYNGAAHLGGSDNNLFLGGANIDSGTAFNTAGSAAGQYHLWLDYLEKTSIGPVYITCEGAWGGVKMSGPTYNPSGTPSNLGGPVWFTNAKVEGRNAGAGCDGANVRQEGGILCFTDSWISYGMVSPGTMGHSPTDAGVIHQTDGLLDVTGCTYDTATSVAETLYWVYQNGSGAVVYANRAKVGSKGGQWTTPTPRIHSAAGTMSLYDASVAKI